MKSVFMTFVFTVLAGNHGTGIVAETPQAAKPVTEAAGAANTEIHEKADEEKDDAAKKSMRMKSRKPMKMGEPMTTPMAKEGMMKGEVKKGMMKKDAEMKKMVQGEEKEMQ